MIWLAKLCQNFYRNNALWEKINFITEEGIIEECYRLEPENKVVQERFLELKIKGIEYCIHEWPAGILFGHDGATLDECKILLGEIPLINELDRKNEYQEFIKDYEDKINEYMERLK